MSTVPQIQTIVSQVTGISISQINSPSRKANVVQARHLSMYFSRFNTNLNLLAIAKQHGRDNHATVIHASTCIHYDKRSNKLVETMYNEIESQVKSLK
jgi:chromosomal replication initiator protein